MTALGSEFHDFGFSLASGVGLYCFRLPLLFSSVRTPKFLYQDSSLPTPRLQVGLTPCSSREKHLVKAGSRWQPASLGTVLGLGKLTR